MPRGRKSTLPTEALAALHARYLEGESLSELERETPYKTGSLAAAFRAKGWKSLGRTNYVPLTDPRAEGALQLWDAGQSAKKAGEEFGLSQTIMSRLLRETGRNGTRVGPDHFHWKGGRGRHSTGYITVWVSPDDPMSSMRKGGHVPEHRLIMARHIGRPLRRDETVHHINGVRDDNRIENLELRIGHHGQGAAWCCTKCGSTDVQPVALAKAEVDDGHLKAL